MIRKDNDIKGFLAGLGLGSVLAGAGVYLISPQNREKVQEKTDEFKQNAEDLISKVQTAVKEAETKGERKLVDELKEAEKVLRRAQQELNRNK